MKNVIITTSLLLTMGGLVVAYSDPDTKPATYHQTALSTTPPQPELVPVASNQAATSVVAPSTTSKPTPKPVVLGETPAWQPLPNTPVYRAEPTYPEPLKTCRDYFVPGQGWATERKCF